MGPIAGAVGPRAGGGGAFGYGHEEGVRARQAASEHRHDRARGPRKDDADGGDHARARRGQALQVHRVRPDRQRARREEARHHHQRQCRRVFDQSPSLRAHRLPRPPRLHQSNAYTSHLTRIVPLMQAGLFDLCA